MGKWHSLSTSLHDTIFIEETGQNTNKMIAKMGQVFLKVPAGDIFQIAELSIMKESEIPEHTQICDEITYVVSGKAKVYSGDECYEMTAGQLHYITKDTYHKIVADADSNFHYCCFGYVIYYDPAKAVDLF